MDGDLFILQPSFTLDASYTLHPKAATLSHAVYMQRVFMETSRLFNFCLYCLH